MSESTVVGGLDDAVVEQLLAAVSEPAVVTDAEGVARAWNDAFETVVESDPGGRAVGSLLAWRGADPVARAVEQGTETAGTTGGTDARFAATCRPLTTGEVVGCVVTLAADSPAADPTLDARGEEALPPDAESETDSHPDTEGEADCVWPVYEAAVDAAPDNLFAVDTDRRIRLVSETFAAATGIPTEAVTGEPLSVLVDHGIVDEPTLERSREAVDAVLAGEREEVTFVSRPAVAGGEVVAENRLGPIRHDGEIVGAVNVVRDVTERSRAEDALRESRERLRTIVDTLPVALVVVDGDERIDHVQGLDLDGVPCDSADLVGADLSAFADEYGDIVAGCRRALAGEAATATTTLGERVCEVFFEPVREDGTVTGTTAVAVDVTDRERRERELAATNERLDLALRHTDAGVFVWHVEADRAYWHESVARLFGVEPERRYRFDEAIAEWVHPDDRERVRRAVERAVSEGSDLAVEFRVERPDGEVRWAAAEGRVEVEDGESDRLVGTIRDVTERKQRETQLVEREQRLRAVIEGSPDPIAMQDVDGRYQVVNEAMVDLTGRPREALRGATPCEAFDGDTATRLERHRRDVLETEAARVVEDRIPTADDGDDRIVQLTVAPHHGSEGTVRGTVTIARDVTELERQHDELETLTAIQRLVQESVRALTAATTRDEIRATVCDRLVDSEFYQSAWIGSFDHASREIRTDYTAGGAAAYLETVTVTTDLTDQGQGPAGEAFRSGEVQVASVREDPAFEPWREVALDYGYESAVAIPLTHGSSTHGVLAAYTDRESFGEREVAGFETLGETVGFALSAAQHRRLLESDRLLELEFTITGDMRPFDRISAERDCRFVFDNAVDTGDGHVVNYLTVEGEDDFDPDALADHVSLVSMNRLDDAGGPDYELKWSQSVHKYLSEIGARGGRVVVEDGTGWMVVEAPVDVDVRQVTEALEANFGAAELTAKRERERSEAAWWRSHRDLGTDLTDRQRSILQAAYYSGYYEWPRETDAESLAESLDIASTTLLQHLRKGHRHVLEAMFES